MDTKEIRPILVYGRPFCGMVAPIRKLLNAVKAPHQYIDIYLDPDARLYVAQLNHGNLSVPTLVFPDGSVLIEPSIQMVKGKLRFLGFNSDASSLAPETLWNTFRSPAIFFTLMTAIYIFFRYIETL